MGEGEQPARPDHSSPTTCLRTVPVPTAVNTLGARMGHAGVAAVTSMARHAAS